ncbi:glycosyltransferase [Caproiciproducens sp. NJN-50]|uniref:glycosyltransferase family 2 protein n=1 Tax=Acutalibacteraceae TaxID=3082771 RepID=UPI000FFE1C11|nr:MULTISPECIES: glycosyltransferase family 2 protein [Acutalibacteraceae]QAT51006.1 glycosyltransferase [Caproiciproducens sp. NJN-50]
MSVPVVYLVIPCYNEEQVLPETVKRLTEKLRSMMSAGLADPKSRMLLVDDGSRDATWRLISEFNERNELVGGVKLAHNRGHQNALLAGLMTARKFADCAVSLDADLQDDVDVLDEFVRKYLDGCDVVYGVRNKRETDTAFKRATALGFYRFMAVLGVDVVYNHADYRLMSRRALDALSEYREVNLFLRGLVPLIGYRSAVVTYDRHERFAGESKYPLKKMLAFAVDGITSFSVKPLKLIFNLGMLTALIGLIGTVWAGIAHFAAGWAGWIAAFWSLWLLGGLVLLGMGVLGTYIGKIYAETKARPRYRIEEQRIAGPEGTDHPAGFSAGPRPGDF